MNAAKKLTADLTILAAEYIETERHGEDPIRKSLIIADVQERLDRESGLLESGKLNIWRGVLRRVASGELAA